MCVSVSEIHKVNVGSIKKRESQERKRWIKTEGRKQIESVCLVFVYSPQKLVICILIFVLTGVQGVAAESLLKWNDQYN
jgi:hypothetical protein